MRYEKRGMREVITSLYTKVASRTKLNNGEIVKHSYFFFTLYIPVFFYT